MRRLGTAGAVILTIAVAACEADTTTPNSGTPIGATADASADADAGSSTSPTPTAPPGSADTGGTELTFVGIYDVPVTPALEAAATYAEVEVHWQAGNGTAHLRYDLPPGLVGGEVEVSFTGPFDSATNTGTLTGPAGTAECTVKNGELSCFETMYGILPLSIDWAIVEADARATYAGPVADRIAVTEQFAVDPLGIIRLDPTKGFVDD